MIAQPAQPSLPTLETAREASKLLADLTALSALVAEATARYSAALKTTPAEVATIRSPGDVARLLGPEVEGLTQERLYILLLNTKNRVQRVVHLYQGSLNASTVRVGELFRDAVKDSAASVIIAHNHPSSDPAPSPEDVRMTAEAVKAGHLLDIEVLDHLIVCSPTTWLSLKERHLGFD